MLYGNFRSKRAIFFNRALILKSKHHYKIRLILSVRGKRDASIFIHLFWNARIPIIKTNILTGPHFNYVKKNRL